MLHRIITSISASKLSTSFTPYRSLSKMSSNIIGLCQMRSTNDKIRNRELVKELFDRSKGKASFLFFPECCDYVGTNAEETLSLAEPLTGETVQFYQKLCKEHSMWGSFGGIHEIIDGHKDGKISNTHILINSDGEVAGTYRKLHLFDVDTPDFKFRESKVVEGGKEITKPVETPIGKVGLQICYDIRFPEGALWLKSRGANLITFPSAFALATGKAHWDILNRCRAIENQCYIVSAAQQGKHNDKRSSYGQAVVVSPWGDIIARCTEELEVQFVDIDLTKIDKVERNMPCSSHRRPDVYTLNFKVQNDFGAGRQVPFIFEKYPIDPSTIFYETEHCVAFTNIRCVVPGHVLVATKRQIPRVEDMTEAETKELFDAACKISKVLDVYHDAKSTTITVQDGEFAGQTVKHVHCHVMPRKPGDFENNDEIYVKLNEHDKEDTTERRRDLSEMIAEAEIYRKLFK
ncbi:nitrilase and fragile histidine triad fusion protein NitFhit [Chironomus tepperi]|uniref:nitrilase and fragile histidine triad fusion protein NitFhit n=1 Tax=Chironomus tepperi TaxID=113505 RepID=UPI00391F5515